MNRRTCGSCRLCCFIFGLNGEFWTGGTKPARKWCEHSCPKGCAVHDQPRPSVCENFMCDWLTNPTLPDDWRPDRIGIILTTLGRFEGQPVIQVSEHYLGLIEKALPRLGINAILLVTYAHEGFTRFRKVINGKPVDRVAGWEAGEKERFMLWATNNLESFKKFNPNDLDIKEVS